MLIALLVLAQLGATTPDPWSLMAQRDVQAMHDAILANHPGPVDAQNPAFRDWLERGLKLSLAKAAEAKTFGGYVYALRFYGAGFRDGHLNSGVMVTWSQIAWPGFLVALRDGKYVVTTVEQNDTTVPAVGSELLDCDGRSARTIVEQDVWPYAMGPMIDSQWNAVAGSLLLDRGNPAMKRPKSCRFRAGGDTKSYDIRYRDTTLDAIGKLASSTTVALRPEPPARPSGEGVWVSIPSFVDADEPTLDRLKTLKSLAPQWRNAPFIVFDVRRNEGGNSFWAGQILSALYGDAFYNQLIDRTFGKQYVEWRVSKDNIAHIEHIAEGIRRRAGEDAARPWLDTAESMKAALAQGKEMWGGPDEEPAEKPPAEPLYKGKVFLLTDSRCASACLDFADRAVRLPNSTHVGLTTNADSVYMENRPVDLPSGIGRLGLPIKVYRNRPRGHNEPYVPAVRYEGDINDTASVEAWIQKLAK